MSRPLSGWPSSGMLRRRPMPACRRASAMTDLPSGAVTFLFTDIEGSTRLVKALREEYVQVLADHRRLVRAAVARQAGYEIDTQGDAFFVAFASAKQAVLCALEIQRALDGHTWPSRASVRVRMGIHTGQAVPVEGVYTGLAVHRAARICAAARGGQVLVSQATQTLIEDEEEEELGFTLAELGERRLKDLARPVRLFELTVADAAPEPPRRRTAPAPLLPAIVGRAAELRIMSAAYTRAVGGQSQVMLITGEAGIGKTRLVEELTGQLKSAADGALVRVGESAPITGTTLAYGPFVAALGHEAQWLLADDPADNMLAARHRLFVRVVGLLSGLAARSPLVLVLEDLHWADESSRELLTFLAVRLREEPVMIVGTLREDDLTDSVRRWLSELEHRPRVTRLRLGRMTDAEIAGLVAGAMPPGARPGQVTAVVAAADGNPLFARELASADPGGPPASITDAVQAKASALTAQARAVVEQVSVADGGMSHALLAATVKLSQARLLTAVRTAVSRRACDSLTVAASNACDIPPSATDTCSTTARAWAVRAEALASTASVIEAGGPPGSALASSLANSGLPSAAATTAVTWPGRAPGGIAPATSPAISASVMRPSRSRVTRGRCSSSLSQRRTESVRSSSRSVPTIITGSSRSRTARNVSSSREDSSAQCRSSRTSTSGDRAARPDSSPTTRTNRRCRAASMLSAGSSASSHCAS